MRIVHCISSLSGGGAERQLSYIAPRMAEKGVDVHITFLTDGPAPPDYINTHQIKLHSVKHKNNYDPLIVLRMVALFRKIRPDIVHTWIPQIDIFSGIAAQLCDIPWVIREANDTVAHSGWKAGLRKVIARRVNHIVANSMGGRKYWEENSPAISNSLVYNGLPDEVFIQPDNFLKRDFTNKTILFAGRLVAQKNIFLLLKAVKILSTNTDLKLVICGEGDQSLLVQQFVDENKLGDFIECRGYVNRRELLKLLNKCALLVSPSYYEGCPNIVLEAMARGCPVAVSSIRAHKDILDEDAAVFFDPDDHLTLVNVIEKVLYNPNESTDRALVARGIAEKFRLDNTVNAYIDIYNKVSRNRRKS